MQIAGDAQALVYASFHLGVEFPRELMHVQAMCRPERQQDSRHDGPAEPVGLIICRGDGEIERVTGIVPHAAVVAGDHPEAVVARRKIGILHFPLVDDILPITVLPLQLVLEMNFLRRDEVSQCSRWIRPGLEQAGAIRL